MAQPYQLITIDKRPDPASIEKLLAQIKSDIAAADPSKPDEQVQHEAAAVAAATGLTQSKQYQYFEVPPSDFNHVIGGFFGYQRLPAVALDAPVTAKVAALDTAAWFYRDKTHNVLLGSRMFQQPSPDLPRFCNPVMTAEIARQYIAAHYVHELGHGFVTIRTPSETKELLESAKTTVKDAEGNSTLAVPSHSLFNLLEDAWMEEYMRQRLNSIKRWPMSLASLLAKPDNAPWTFGWLNIETSVAQQHLNASAAQPDAIAHKNPTPESIFLACIQAEGNIQLVRETFSFVTQPEVQTMMEAVIDLYQRLLASMIPAQQERESKNLITLPPEWPMAAFLREWMEKFHQPSENKNSSSPSDLQLGSILSQLSPETLAELQEAANENAGQKSETTESSHKDGQRGSLEAASGDSVLDETDHPIDMRRVQKMAQLVDRVLTARDSRTWTELPSKRSAFEGHRVLNMDTAGSPFRSKTPRPTQGLHDIVVILDCSGSMGGGHTLPSGEQTTFAKEGVVLASVLSLLAQQRKCSGYVILTGVVSGKNGNYVDAWERHELPLSPDVLKRISGIWSGEGLLRCMRDNAAVLKKAKHAFVFTDGSIGDRAEFSREEFTRQGIRTKGLYVANNSVANPRTEQVRKDLEKWFGETCIHDSIELVFDALLRSLRA